MPATRQSLQITEEYRAKLIVLSRDAQRDARQLWKQLDWNELRASYVPIGDALAVKIITAQTEGVHLSAGYLGAYLTSELREPVAPPRIALNEYVGRSFQDEPLRPALDKPLIAVLVAIEEGKEDPLGLGLRALLANVDLDVMAASRRALGDAIEADERCDGYRRAVKGTCPACVAKATDLGRAPEYPVHPHCRCVAEPVIKGVADRYQRRRAQEQFDSMSFKEQNDSYGFDVAQLIRDGRVSVTDLVRVDGTFMWTRALKDLNVKATSPLSYEQRMDRVIKGLDAKKPPQRGVKTLDDLFEQAEDEKQAFREFVDLRNQLQRRLGADALVDDANFKKLAKNITAADRPQIVVAPLKKRTTAADKIERKLGQGREYGPQNLSDINRASIVVKGQDDIPAVFAQVRRWADERGWRITDVEDKFRKANPPLHYRDVAINLVSPSGHVTELQFHVNNMWAAKFRGGGHELYERLRKLDQAEARRALSADELATRAKLRKKSEDLYDAALLKPTPSRPSGAATRQAVEDMSVGETEFLVLGPTNRATRTILDNFDETRWQHAMRDPKGNALMQKTPWGEEVPVYTPARQRLHQQIIKKFLKGEVGEKGIARPTRQEHPKVVSTAGGGASGKSTLIADGEIRIDGGAVVINPDLVKQLLPEYDKMLKIKDPWAASAVHEQSSYLAKLITQAALKQNFNVLLDVVGGGKPGKYLRKLDQFKRAGYDVEINYASVPTKTALARNLVREQKTGRRVPPERVTADHREAARRFDEVVKEKDYAVRVWDTSERPPKLVFEKRAGETGGRVVDRAGYQRWLDKQDYEKPQRVTAEEFHSAVGRFIAESEHGKFLTDYGVKDYKGMRTFLAENGKVGGALKPTGDGHWEMVSLFNNGGSKGAGMRMFRHQVAEGGDRLDCIGDGLRGLYEREGFRVVKTIKWDDKYAPDGWDYKRWGRPNIYVMEKAEPILAREALSNEIPGWRPKAGPIVDRAIDVIEETHDYPPGALRTPIEAVPLKPHLNAMFNPVKPHNRIALNPTLAARKPDEVLPTILHEAGHKLDWDLGETLREEGIYAYASEMAEDEEDMEALIEAIHSTEGFERLKRSGFLTQNMAAYLLEPRELFARAYAQYVLVRNDLQELIEAEDVEQGLQWGAADFVAIAEAFDSMLSGRGLLGSRAVRRARTALEPA